MKLNHDDLVEQVNWLLKHLDTAQVLRVLSLANRIFVTEDPNPDYMQFFEPPRSRRKF